MKLAIILPCHNEAHAIGTVVQDFRRVLPEASIYVYDNNSTDNTIAVAKEAGAIVRTETMQGKGYVVRRMFADVDADIYVLADGDGTYDANDAPRMVEMLKENMLDMVTGVRMSQEKAAYRLGHVLGNHIITGTVKKIFGDKISDLLSGYRIFSRRFVKSFPIFSQGFEVETELSVHALELHLPINEVETNYIARVEGSVSKLSTYRDGFLILRTIFHLVRGQRPKQFYGFFALLFLMIALLLGMPLVSHYIETGFVERTPTAVLSAAVMILAFMTACVGLIISGTAKARKEVKKLAYLSYPYTKQD